MNRFNIKDISEFFGSTEGNANIGETFYFRKMILQILRYLFMSKKGGGGHRSGNRQGRGPELVCCRLICPFPQSHVSSTRDTERGKSRKIKQQVTLTLVAEGGVGAEPRLDDCKKHLVYAFTSSAGVGGGRFN